MTFDYWGECVAEAFEDAGIAATPGQVATVVSWVEGAHENHGQASGSEVASSNYHAAEKREKEKLRADLAFEQEKGICRDCNGNGRISTSCGPWVSNSECANCRGDGKVHPTKDRSRSPLC